MDFEKFSWELFEKTGHINIYLALKDDRGAQITDSTENRNTFSGGKSPAQKEDLPAGV